MAAAVLVGRVFLAGVFGVAGATKLTNMAGSREAVRSFGFPPWAATPTGVALPVLELAVAALLLPANTARSGASTALALLLMFAFAIAVALARGRQPECHCFGQLHSAPVGPVTLARDLVLAGVAAFVLVAGARHPGPNAFGWIADLSPAVIVGLLAGVALGAVLLFQAWFSLQLLRQNGRLLARLDAIESRLGASGVDVLPRSPSANGGGMGSGRVRQRERNGEAGSVSRRGLAVGVPAPSFALPRLDGAVQSLDALRSAGKPVLLVFSDPGCGPCIAVLTELASWQEEQRERITLVLVSRGDVEENRAKTRGAIEFVLLQRDREVAQAYRCHGTPGAVVVAPDGLISSPLAEGADQIRTLVGTATQPLRLTHVSGGAAGNVRATRVATAPPSCSARPPKLTLPDLDGHLVAVSHRLSRDTLLLLWDPRCGFCQAMLDDLKALEDDRPRGAPELIVVSTGSAEENRAQGLRSMVVLDDEFTAGATFGATGTPAAVLLDAHGMIASPVAVGKVSVMRLSAR